MNSVKSFEDLTCWKKARQLKKRLYQLAKQIPDYEQFRLSSQIRGAAVSVTANIAEGYGRYGYQEKIQFARISRASLLELQDHLYTCCDAGYIDDVKFKSLYDECIDVGKSINGYLGYILDQKNHYSK
ncbi:four helix bundle protein [Patescibacteria group bacterium]|nr:four helix bundle protein [Patescibacteria group bacterium]